MILPSTSATSSRRFLGNRRFSGWLGAVFFVLLTSVLLSQHAAGQTLDYGDYSSFTSASSTRNSTLRIGASVDAESSATTNSSATGDDNTGSDDEDGVTLPASLVPGQSTSITVNVTNGSSSTGYLNAWIDFNRNGSLTDSGEQIASNTTIARGTSGANRLISFTVPSGASLGTAGIRVRLTTTSSPGPTGTDGSGEVEDYVITIANPSDYGDYSPFPSASSAVNSNLRLGATVDSELSATTNSSATGDDNTGSDDEDGVTLPASVQQGSASSMAVVVTNGSGSTAYLNAWIDWNNNGVLTDSGEQVATNVTVANGVSNSTRTINFTPPANAVIGSVGVRVRLTSVSSPGSDGLDGNGEVEDHVVNVASSLGIGNLVWNDSNDNGLKDSSESGINNVLVELWTPGADNAIGGTSSNADTKVASTTTASGGIYGFSGLTAGRYFVKIPTPPLSRVSSVVDAADNGDDLDNDGAQPSGSGTAAYSPVIQLAAGTEPGASGGGNVDNTIDFGFVANVGAPFVCDNRFYIMQNVETSPGSGNWDTTLYYIESDQTLEPLFMYSGKKLNGLASYGGYLYCVDQNGGHLYRINSLGTLVDMGEIEGFPSSATDGQWGGATSLTTGQMILNRYTFSNARTTLYTIDLGSASLVGTPVVTKYSSTGSNTTGNFGDIVWDPLTDKIYGYNTNDSSNLGLFEINPTTGMCTRVAASFLSTFGSLVIDANGLAYGYGSQSSSTAQDTLYVFNRTNGVLNGTMTTVGSGPVVTNSDGAACPGAPPSMKLGNLVWNDANDNGLKDSNEQGIDGVALRLFLGGENPLTATPAATVTTAGGGLYEFDNLSPGQYFIYIPTPPAAYPLSSYTTDTADNSQDNDDNGTQTSQGQPVRSPLISLVAGTESTTDGDGDSNSDLTVDFGFRACPVLNFGGANAPVATVGVPYSHTFTTGNGSGLYTWSLASGTLPAGLNMSTAGVVSGTPTVSNGAGVSVTVRVTDSLGCQATSAVTLVVLPNMDFGDYSSFPSASSIASTALRIGGSVDTEASATANSAATGDDLTGTDDEDGVTLPTTVEQGTANTLSVTVTNSSGAAAYLNVWMDFNRNGNLGDSGELIATNVLIANGTSNAARIVNFNVPATASVGASAVRVRLTSVTTPGPEGADGTGEVEDHATSIIPPTRDYGDYAGFTNASQRVNPSLKLGAQVDAEGTPVTNADGTGDDISGTDDEDAVTFPSMTAGQPVTLTVPVTNQTGSPGYVNAWIDFNNDEVLQVEEQIVSQVLVPAGSSNVPLSLDFTVPTDAVTAATFVGARFRFSEEPTPGPTGAGGDGEVEDYAVVILAPITDFGDWNQGPSVSNTADSRLRLGSSVDAEYAATTNAAATGDDITGVDDEDGVTFSAFTAGAPATVQVTRTNTTGAVAYLNGWIDFNNNGSFGDSGEQILTNASVANGTSGNILTTNITVPANAVTGTPLGARFRITSLASPGTGGAGGTGEVEDYVVTVAEPTTDFGDHQGLASASSLRDPALFMGAAIDTEYVATLNALATGDDTTGTDDEDGVTLSAMTAGGPATIPVVVTNLTGGTAYLNAWVDFNGNGVLTDAGEQITTNVSVPAGATSSTVNLNITVPATSLTGINLAARFRLSNVSGAAPAGAAGNGEVEDYVVMVSAPTTDFGDYSGFADASQGVSPSLRMGASVDAEYASTRNATATGDDLTGTDDEDGVTIPALTAGAAATISINVSNSTGALGYINGWIDFNNNGLLTDAGEQVASNINVVTGTNNGTVTFTVNVPAGTVTGTPLGARFRLSAPLSPGPVGSNPAVGEVEDYAVTVAAPTTDFGDYSGFSPASSTVEATLRLGALTDTEYAQTANLAAAGDDTTGVDDEDALVVPALSAGGGFTLPIAVTNNRGSSAFLNVWIDYNNNGVLTDAGEQLATNVVVANGTAGGTVNVAGTVPAAAVTGTNIGLRIRLTSVSNPGTIGLAGTGEVEDYIVNIAAPTRDYGDWSGAGDVSNGVSNNLRLGATLDAEAASTRNANATGDDITGTDDEDGVTLPSMTAGQAVTIPVIVTNTTGASAFLNAWIDFNNNGVFTDAGEQITSNNLVANASNGAVVNLAVNVPANAVTGSNLGARFRLTTVSNPGSVGDGAGVGEVEDYVVNVAVPTTDFGDYSGFAAAASTQTPALRLGALTDTEYSPTANLTATGDDTTGADDEDGAVLPALVAGAPASIPVTVTNTTGGTAYLNVWIDFNNNGVIADAGEQVASNMVVATGVSESVQNVNFTVPAGAVTGQPLGVRFRLTHVQNPGPVGTAGLGEVEDYTATIDVPPSDYGDWNRADTAFSTLRAGLRLGNLIDTEYAPVLNATATGDDSTGVDDEDGAVLPEFTAGGPAVIPVAVTNTTGATAYLNVWMDFNNNGSFDDLGEQLADNVLIATGQTNVLRNVSLTVPPNAVTGATVGLRFRLTNISTPGSTGGAGQGEVEDYATTVAVPTTDFGDWDGAADASSIASSDLRLGALADTEYAPTRNAAATGDDATASDDEDGVVLPSSLSLGASGSLVTTITNNFGSSAYVNAWVDFNGNGSFADGGEQIATNVIVSNGSNGVTRSLGFTTPSNAKPGLRGVRVRLTSVQNPGSVGAAGTGEVEDYLLQINCPAISLSPATLTVPVVGKPYNVTFTSNGGTGPYTFTVTSGSLPAGLTLAAGGALTGAATTTTPVNFTVTGTDANGCSTSINYAVTPVCPAIPISPSSLQTPTIGSAYNQTITASGGTAPYTFMVESGSLPTGLSLGVNNGVVSGTPSQAGAFNFVLKVTDFYGCSATQNYSLTPSCPSIAVTPSSLPAPVVGTAYSQTLTPTGGVGPYSLSVSSGALPAGLALSSSGVLSGTPTSSSSAMFVVRAVDSRGCAGTRAFSLAPTCPALSVQTTSLGNGYLGTSYSATLAASGGAAPYSWSVSSGALPPGLALSSAGVLSGTPTALGSFTFTARAADSNSCAASRSLTVTVKGMSLGNRVWLDNNNNGLQDADENGVAGVTVELFTPGADNAIGGVGSSADVRVGMAFTTGADGLYLFGNLAPGMYYVKVTAPEGFTHSSGTAAAVDNNVDGNNDGAQPGGVGTLLFSPVITLSAGAESTNDGDGDADTNLTVDFGLWAPLAVGNVVFIDVNRDGRMNANEGVGYAFIQLFRAGQNPATDTPVNAAMTDSKGRYLVMDIDPGSYFLHLPAIQFEDGGVLRFATPITSVSVSDDNVGQDLLPSSNPVANGASTAVFTLLPGQLAAGTAESGVDGMSDDDGIDSNTDLTFDLGLECLDCSALASPAPPPPGAMMSMAASLPAAEFAALPRFSTYAAWREFYLPEGQRGALDNADADFYLNLMEYALGTDPSSGSSGAGGFKLVTDPFTGQVNAQIQTAGPAPDIRVVLETSRDGETWNRSAVSPQLSSHASAGRVLVYEALESEDFAAASIGYVRAKAILDADLNGEVEAEAAGPVWVFSRQVFPVGTRSFSMPLEQPELYAGLVLSVEEDHVLKLVGALNISPDARALHVEVLSGTSAGQLLHVTAVDGSRLQTLEKLPQSMAGARVALRASQTLNGVLPAQLFVSGSSSEDSDRVLAYDAATNAFVPVTHGADGWSTDLALLPDEAVLVQNRHQEVNVWLAGQLPGRAPRALPKTGTRFTGTRQVAPLSPARLGLGRQEGFPASAEPAGAARLRLWKADSDSAAEGYESLYLHAWDAGTLWLREGDPLAQDMSAEPVLLPFHGFFLVQPQ